MRRVCFLLCVVGVLQGSAPWDVEQEAKEALKAQIEAKHKERCLEAFWKGYFVDLEKRYINRAGMDCVFCQNKNSGKQIMQSLESAGFQKMAECSEISGHCYGITALFVQYLLDYPPAQEEGCKDILERFTQGPDFLEKTHILSVNQPLDYIQVYREDKRLSREELSHAIPWLKTSSMKQFFNLTLGRIPESYYFLTYKESAEIEDQFTLTSIYSFLQQFENKVLFLNYKEKNGAGHCFSIYNKEGKLLLFDANTGLFQFYDKETLSWFYAEQLVGCRLSWIAAFSLE